MSDTDTLHCPSCGATVLAPEPIREVQEQAQAAGAIKSIAALFIGGTVILPLVIVVVTMCFVVAIMALVFGAFVPLFFK